MTAAEIRRLREGMQRRRELERRLERLDGGGPGVGGATGEQVRATVEAELSELSAELDGLVQQGRERLSELRTEQEKLSGWQEQVKRRLGELETLRESGAMESGKARSEEKRLSGKQREYGKRIGQIERETRSLRSALEGEAEGNRKEEQREEPGGEREAKERSPAGGGKKKWRIAGTAAAVVVIAAVVAGVVFYEQAHGMLLRLRIDEQQAQEMNEAAREAAMDDELSEAVETLEQVVRAYPEEDEARFDLVSVYALQGDEQRARETAEEVLERDPEHEQAREWLRLLGGESVE